MDSYHNHPCGAYGFKAPVPLQDTWKSGMRQIWESPLWILSRVLADSASLFPWALGSEKVVCMSQVMRWGKVLTDTQKELTNSKYLFFPPQDSRRKTRKIWGNKMAMSKTLCWKLMVLPGNWTVSVKIRLNGLDEKKQLEASDLEGSGRGHVTHPVPRNWVV